MGKISHKALQRLKDRVSSPDNQLRAVLCGSHNTQITAVVREIKVPKQKQILVPEPIIEENPWVLSGNGHYLNKENMNRSVSNWPMFTSNYRLAGSNGDERW
jgi:hypothetical protein